MSWSVLDLPVVVWLRPLLEDWTKDLRGGHLWPGLSVLTLATYNTWLLWRPMNGHRAIFNGYLSEFSASDQPHSFFFRGGDLLTAIIVLGLGGRALVLWRRRRRAAADGVAPRPSRWWAVASVFLLLFGLSTFFDAFFAMDCSPSLSQACRVAEETGQLSTVHYAHTYTSVGAQTGIVASMVATFIAMCRSSQQTRTRRLVVLAISVFEVVALVVMMVMLLEGAPGLGYPQAVMVAVASLWFAAVGFRLVGEDAVPRPFRGLSKGPSAPVRSTPVPADLRSGGEVVTELGGRSVHLLVRGGEGPPIVLLGGCAVPSYAFADVVDLLPRRWVVSLDRPGMVATPWPGTLPSLAEELATLVALAEALGEPAVVVAHSMAGPHAEALARAAPGSVRGLVLLDASVELEPRRPHSPTPWLLTSRAVRRATGLAVLARLGSLGERTLVSAQSVRRRLTDAQPEVFRELFRRPDTLAMVVAEQAAYAGQLWDLAQQRRDLPWPGTPTLVVTAAGDGGPKWVAVQQELAQLLGGRQVVVEDSRHLLMIDRPDLVAEAALSFTEPAG